MVESSEVAKKTAKATKWSTVTEVVSKCIVPLTNLILARLLTPEAFGVVATITMVVSFAEIFTDAGFQKYLMQHEFSSEEELNKNTNVAFWTNLLLSLLIWGIICVFNNPLAELVGCPGLGNVLIVAAISIPLVAFSSIQMARYKRDFNFKSLFFIRIISTFVPFLVTVPLAFILRNYWALVIGTLAGNIVNAIILTLKSKWKPKMYYSFSVLKQMFSYSWWILLETLASWLTSYIGTFIVGRVLSLYYVGLYKTSMTTVNQITSLITASTSGPLFIALSKLQNNKEEMLKTYYKFIGAIGVFVIPLGVGIFLFRELVTTILLGEQWVEAANFIGIWGLTSSFSLIFGTYCNGLYNAQGKTYLSFIAQILHLVVLIPVLIFAVNKGFECLYISRSLIRIEFIVVQLLIMKICLKASLGKLFKTTIPSLLATMIMILVALLLKLVSQILIWQIISVAICVCIYFCVLFLIHKQTLIDCLALFDIKIKLGKEKEKK